MGGLKITKVHISGGGVQARLGHHLPKFPTSFSSSFYTITLHQSTEECVLRLWRQEKPSEKKIQKFLFHLTYLLLGSFR